MEPPVQDPQVSRPEAHEDLLLLVSEMRDELSAYRWREAIWISIVVHVLFFLALIFGPKLIPMRAVLLPVQQRSQDATFLAMPPDQQRVKPPKTDIISDKDRVAQARVPMPNKETLRRLLDASRPGPPKPVESPAPPAQQAQAAPPPQGNAAQQQPAPRVEPAPARTPSPFTTPAPGSSVNRAIESVASNRPSATSVTFGGGGEYGARPSRPRTDSQGALDILSDTMGVDFGPYLARMKVEVQNHWEPLIPEIARPPMMKSGVVVIEFSILKNGQVVGMKLISSSGDVALDRAAWGAITSSMPLPHLPANFSGDYLQIRARFYYNPDQRSLQ